MAKKISDLTAPGVHLKKSAALFLVRSHRADWVVRGVSIRRRRLHDQPLHFKSEQIVKPEGVETPQLGPAELPGVKYVGPKHQNPLIPALQYIEGRRRGLGADCFTL